MEPPDNLVELSGHDPRLDLLADYDQCCERRQIAIRRFAHKLAELERYHPPSAQILPFVHK